MHVTPALSRLFHRYPFDHQNQLRPGHFHTLTRVVLPGKFKGALLKALIIQNEATGFPAKQFYPVPSAVNENEHFPGGGVAFKLTLHQPAQTVKALAHVCYPGVEVEPQG